MMKAFSLTLMAVAVSAATEHDDEAAGKYNDACFQCIDNGYAFCSADGLSGTCVDYSCTEDELEG